MRDNKHHNIDLRLLAMFIEMMRTGSVSATANALDTSQPAVSMSLARLRKHYGDPLFVRTSEGMKPTSLAQELQEPLTRAYLLLNEALSSQSSFDPATSTRLFRIAMADAGYLGIFPRLIKRQQEVAPNIRLEFTSIIEKTGMQMEAGDIDLTIAFMPQLGRGVYQQLLLEQTFVGAVRQDHPRIRSRLTIKDYQRESHLSIAPSGTGHWVLNSAIEQAGINRKIAWQVQSYLGIPPIISNSDYIVTIPKAAADYFEERGVLRSFPLPFPTPPIVVMQYWHERFHRDSGLMWLRRQLLDLFSHWSKVPVEPDSWFKYETDQPSA